MPNVKNLLPEPSVSITVFRAVIAMYDSKITRLNDQLTTLHKEIAYMEKRDKINLGHIEAYLTALMQITNTTTDPASSSVACAAMEGHLNDANMLPANDERI